MEPRISLVTDCVIFNESGALLLVRRAHDPFAGAYALPGGFVEYGETVEAGALRELKEETGLDASNLRLIGVYSDPNRDPRGHIVSVAFTAKVAADAMPRGGDDAASAEFVQDWRNQEFAFDHRKIIEDALKRGI